MLGVAALHRGIDDAQQWRAVECGAYTAVAHQGVGGRVVAHACGMDGEGAAAAMYEAHVNPRQNPAPTTTTPVLQCRSSRKLQPLQTFEQRPGGAPEVEPQPQLGQDAVQRLQHDLKLHLQHLCEEGGGWGRSGGEKGGG